MLGSLHGVVTLVGLIIIGALILNLIGNLGK